MYLQFHEAWRDRRAFICLFANKIARIPGQHYDAASLAANHTQQSALLAEAQRVAELEAMIRQQVG